MNVEKIEIYKFLINSQKVFGDEFDDVTKNKKKTNSIKTAHNVYT